MPDPLDRPDRALVAPLLLAALALAAVAAGVPTAAATAATAAEDPATAGMPPEPPGFTLGGDPAAGAAVFAKSCVLCHGPAGHGDGRIKSDPPPRDFTHPEGLRTSSDWQLYQVIRNGGAILGMSPRMLPWKDILSDREIRDVAAYVRSLGKAKSG